MKSLSLYANSNYLPLSLTFIGFTLRLYHLGSPSLWYDELLQLDIAQGAFRQIIPQLPLHSALPLDYFLLHGWLYGGQQEAWVRFPALVWGTLAIPLTYQLGRAMFKRSVATLAASLLTLHPFAIHYSQEARPYSLLVLLVLGSYLGIWQAYRRPAWGLAGGGLLLGSLTHYFALIAWLPLTIYVILHQLYRRTGLPTFIFTLHLLLISLMLLIVGRPLVMLSVGSRFAQALSQPSQFTAPNKPNGGSGPPLELNYLTDAIVFPLTSSEPIGVLLYGSGLLSAVIGLLRRPFSRTHEAVSLLLGGVIIPIIMIYLFLVQRGTFFASRYILYTLPLLLILTAHGARRLSGQSPSLFLLMGAALGLSHLSPLQYYYQAPAYEDWRAVGQLLQAAAQPHDAIIALRAEPAINWYYPAAAQPFHTYSDLAVVQAAIDKAPRRWFILSSYSRQQDTPLRQWLQGQGAAYLPIDSRVVVYFQQRGLSPAETLAEVATFPLPPIARLHAHLAEQFCRVNDLPHCRQFYQQAITLAPSPQQQAEYQTRWAELGLK